MNEIVDGATTRDRDQNIFGVGLSRSEGPVGPIVSVGRSILVTMELSVKSRQRQTRMPGFCHMRTHMDMNGILLDYGTVLCST